MTNTAAALYIPRTLGDEPDPWVVDIGDRAADGQVILYVGAGISVPAPASGPRGDDVADALRDDVAELLGVDPDEVARLNLEELAERVDAERPRSLDHLKRLAAEAWRFTQIVPNYVHEALALLLREGTVSVITANWDCGVERGGLKNGIAIRSVSRAQDMRDVLPNELPLYKVHGCASRPRSLVLTQREVDRPRDWARNRVQATLDGGHVVFVGLGTVGAYVSEPVEKLAQAWGDGDTTIRIVDLNGPSEAWREALTDQVDSLSRAMSADRFADDLLRSIVRKALLRARGRARAVHGDQDEDWSAAIVKGVALLRSALDASNADAVLRWWRGSVSDAKDGDPFILDRPGRLALLAVAQLVAQEGDEAVAEGERSDLTVRGAKTYYEIAYWPDVRVGDVEVLTVQRIEERRAGGRYGPGYELAAVVAGADGRFPDPSAPLDIAALDDGDHADVAAGPVAGVKLYDAEAVVRGWLRP